MVICLERGADLHMAQLMPLPLTVSCSSKIQIGFIFLVPAHPGSLGKGAVKRVYYPDIIRPEFVCYKSTHVGFGVLWQVRVWDGADSVTHSKRVNAVHHQEACLLE